jgi:hypothetical protein
MDLTKIAAIYHKAVHPGTDLPEARVFARKFREISESNANFSWWRLDVELRRQNPGYTEQHTTGFRLRMRDLFRGLDAEDLRPDPEPSPRPEAAPAPDSPPKGNWRRESGACPGEDYRWVSEYIYEDRRTGEPIIVDGYWRRKPRPHWVKAHVRVVRGMKIRVSGHWRCQT